MLDIESKIIAYHEKANDYRLCLTREDIEEIKKALNNQEQIRAEVIEFISDKLIYPLLDEYDRGLWEHISHIDLAREWIKVLDDNPYPKVKNYTESRKKDLRQWIAKELKEKNK